MHEFHDPDGDWQIHRFVPTQNTGEYLDPDSDWQPRSYSFVQSTTEFIDPDNDWQAETLSVTVHDFADFRDPDGTSGLTIIK
jgi:hypothetical protein